MSTYRRTVTVLIAVGILIAPAAALRLLCLGQSCDEPAPASTGIPFCSLPEPVRTRVAHGYRLGRSPGVMGITAGVSLTAPSDGADIGVPWPSTDDASGWKVPIVFWGTGVTSGAEVPAETGVDDIAPTVAEIVGLKRPHPEVRSGKAVEGLASGDGPRLVLLVALKGIGSSSAASMSFLGELVDEGAGTFEGDTGSLPVDPVAVMTSIGTGGLPDQHGMVAGTVLDDEGRLVVAWGPGSPVSVIATLGDDLDRKLRQKPLIGLAGTAPGDRGLIGGNWYPSNDRDDVRLSGMGRAPRAVVRKAFAVLARGFGRDAVPDLMAAALEGDPATVDAQLRRLVAAARRASGGSAAVAVAGTGQTPGGRGSAGDPSYPAAFVARAIEGGLDSSRPVVDRVVPGGVYLDQRTAAREGITEDQVVDLMKATKTRSGKPLFADVFSSFAVSLARYC